MNAKMLLAKMKLPKPVTRFIGKTSSTCKEKSPQILFISGTILFGYTIYKTIERSLYLPEVIEKHKAEMNAVNEIAEESEETSKLDIFIDKAAVTIRTIARGGKLYAIPIVTAAGSFGCYLGAMKIINGRYISTAGAFAALMKEKTHLEEGIVKQYGEEKLEELRAADPSELVKVREEDENGKVSEEVVGPTYGLFDMEFSRETNPDNYEDDMEGNRTFLWHKQCWCNKLLDMFGELWGYEVLEILGYDKKMWPEQYRRFRWKKYKTIEEAKAHGADNFIDFGIFMNTPEGSEKAMFKKGYDRIILRFNIDPEPVFDKRAKT